MLIVSAWFLLVHLYLCRKEGKKKNRRRERGQDRQRQTVRGLFVAPSPLCTAALPSMWLSVIACSLLLHSQRSNHRSVPLFTSPSSLALYLLHQSLFLCKSSVSPPSFCPSISSCLTLSHKNTLRLFWVEAGSVICLYFLKYLQTGWTALFFYPQRDEIGEWSWWICAGAYRCTHIYPVCACLRQFYFFWDTLYCQNYVDTIPDFYGQGRELLQ